MRISEILYALATGMVRARSPSSVACKDTVRFKGIPSSAKRYILGTMPQVEREIFRALMHTPPSAVTLRKNLSTSS